MGSFLGAAAFTGGLYLLYVGFDIFVLMLPENFFSWKALKTFFGQIFNYESLGGNKPKIDTLRNISEQSSKISSPKLIFDPQIVDVSEHKQNSCVTETSAKNSNKGWFFIFFFNLLWFNHSYDSRINNCAIWSWRINGGKW